MSLLILSKFMCNRWGFATYYKTKFNQLENILALVLL